MKVAHYQPPSGFGARAQPDRTKVMIERGSEKGHGGQGRGGEDVFVSPEDLH